MSDNWKNDRGEMEMRKHDKIMMEEARRKSLQEKVDKFKSLDNDVDRWRWVIDNQDLCITVFLDNDDTFIALEEVEFGFIPEDQRTLQFSGYVGWSDGIFDLLEAIGVKAQGV